MSNKLFNKKEMDFDKEGLYMFKQYISFVESSRDISNRRQASNTYFLTIHTLLISGLAIFVEYIDLVSPNRYLLLSTMVAGITFSIFWFRLIRSHKQLNKAKFEIIHKLEARLPVNCYSYEWDLLQADKGYRQFSETEIKIPLLFIFLYLVMSLYVIFA